MHWSLKCGKKMKALCDESVEEHQLADPADDTGQNSWNASQTRMLISHFKENAILWDKRLKDNGNKAKTKKTMAPLVARFGKTQPPRSLKEI